MPDGLPERIVQNKGGSQPALALYSKPTPVSFGLTGVVNELWEADREREFIPSDDYFKTQRDFPVVGGLSAATMPKIRIFQLKDAQDCLVVPHNDGTL